MNYSELPVPMHLGLKGFQQTPISQLEQYLTRSPERIQEQGELLAFRLFHAMARRVPAYKAFLRAHQISPESIKSPSDLHHVPWIDKENYLKKYPLADLCWDGMFSGPMISSSSGSSGTPTFWPRSEYIEAETTYIFELFLKHLFDIDRRRSLFINSFAMGIYVGGSFTMNCCQRINEKGYPLSTVTPGISMADTLSAFRGLADNYEHLILGGYPPFLKDILDELEAEGIDLKQHRISFQFAAEAVSEDFRSYMYDRIGVIGKEYYQRSMTLYGTADAAVAGHETPLTILIRRKLSENEAVCRKYFGTGNPPSLNVYYPFFKPFDTINDELLLSSYNNAVPLLRYNIHDRGGLFSAHEAEELCRELGLDKGSIKEEIGALPWNLPFVFLHGKSDATVSLYGLLVYPDTIKKVLQQKEPQELLTGKFVMQVLLDDQKNQYLQLTMERKPQKRESQEFVSRLQEDLIETLCRENAEFQTLYRSDTKRYRPRLAFADYEDSELFPRRIKHKWSR